MGKHLRSMLGSLRGSLYDLAPIFVVVAIFQLLVLKQPIPDLLGLMLGAVLVVIGLTLFVVGLETGLFPLGETMAHEFARKGSVVWLLIFAFALGFGTTVAEPALIAVTAESARVAAEAGLIESHEAVRNRFALELRLSVALAVGLAIVIGVFRILMGWSLPILVIAGYVGVVVLTQFAPPEIIGVAYDAGGVTTSTLTVPLVTALGVGLASSIKGRNPVIDGFGLIAFASLTPMIFVMGYGISLS